MDIDIKKKYYFDNTNLEEFYSTIWYGYLTYIEIDIIIPYYELNDLLTEICDINFYINFDDNKIYISVDSDTKYYFYQFEKDIKNIILKIEEKFNINIDKGEFNAVELKFNSNQYKYTISRECSSTRKIILKKKILNWATYNKKKNTSDIDNLCAKTNSLNL